MLRDALKSIIFMKGPGMYTLQNRWQLENKSLVYYGMRKQPYLLKNTIKLSKSHIAFVKSLPKTLDNAEKRKFSHLIDQGIVVPIDAKRETINTVEDATYCKTCVANDYMIPGLEFDDDGICPMCATHDDTASMQSVLPVQNTFPRNEKGRFDVALFYTGGKDSSYLLYYLAVEQNLRVLALTWDMPFMSESAKQSVVAARKKLKNVEFVSRHISEQDMHSIYQALYERAENTCACPTLAYMLFFPDLVFERVPYIVAGVEPVQMMQLYFNRFAPKMTYNPKVRNALKRVMNVGRVLTLRKPLKKGQMETLLMMRQLAFGDPWFKRFSSYKHEILHDILAAIDTLSSFKKPLKRAVRHASKKAAVPAFVHVDFNETSKDGYNWENVKASIKRNLGWVEPPSKDKSLHTSCDIETCKDYTQWVRFKQMKSTMIPFSALELSLASRAGHLSKDAALKEMHTALGFYKDSVKGCEKMMGYLDT